MTHHIDRHNRPTHSRTTLWWRLCGVFAGVAALAASVGCNGNEHSDFVPVGQQGWLYGDTLTFTPCRTDSDSIVAADIAVALRHANDYEYSNIWIAMSYTGRDSVVTDTVQITLADDFGNWLGRGMGVSYQLIDTVLHDVAVNVSEPVKIRHIMRTDTLTGIEQMGVVVTDKQPKP